MRTKQIFISTPKKVSKLLKRRHDRKIDRDIFVGKVVTAVDATSKGFSSNPLKRTRWQDKAKTRMNRSAVQ